MRHGGRYGTTRRALGGLTLAGLVTGVWRVDAARASGGGGHAPAPAAPPHEAFAPSAAEAKPAKPPGPKPPAAKLAPPAPTDPVANGRTVDGYYASDPVSGLALGGFDPVSYFLPGATAPQGGRVGIECRHAGVDWRFASAANREAFRRDPAVYLPRCGGFDPVGVVGGRLVEADPLVFALVGGRLYLFRNAERRAGADAATLGEAERRYPALAMAPE